MRKKAIGLQYAITAGGIAACILGCEALAMNQTDAGDVLETRAPKNALAPYSVARALLAGPYHRATRMLPAVAASGAERDEAKGEKIIQRWLKLPEDIVTSRRNLSADIADALADGAQGSGTRILLLERIFANEWIRGGAATYERLTLYSVLGEADKHVGDLKGAGLVPLASEEWRLIETITQSLLREGPFGNNGISGSTELDVVIVQLFDGERWRVGQYYNFEELTAGNLGLSARQGTWLLMLLHCVNVQIEPAQTTRFMRERYGQYIRQLTLQAHGDRPSK